MFQEAAFIRSRIFRTQLLIAVFGTYIFGHASDAAAKTTRKADVRVQNKTGRKISIVSVSHKYSNNFKEANAWTNLPSDGFTTAPLKATYNTGFGTTGRDWWQVSWQFEDDPKTVYTTNPKNFREIADALETVATKLLPVFAEAVVKKAGGPKGSPVTKAAAKALSSAVFNSESTVGFKQHILRTEDAGKFTTIVIYGDKVEFVSPSGKSTTGIKATAAK